MDHRPHHQPQIAAAPPADRSAVLSDDGAGGAPIDAESVLVAIDASLRVHDKHQFCEWSQGLLQYLLKHELLICALCGGSSISSQVDAFAASPLDSGLFEDLFRRDTALVAHLIKAWTDNNFEPVSCSLASGEPFAESKLAVELARSGLDCLIVHGTCDTFGKPVSLFTFFGSSEEVGPKQLHFAELLVPFIYLAWSRFLAAQVDRSTKGTGANPARPVAILTLRQQEILKWVHRGKSNHEIGMILGLSPLTVKNHVQSILHKLNVRNRAQAVGEALAQRILIP